MTDRQGPLAGVRVMEIGAFIAGPFAGQLLADYGAEVLKIESPDEGDPMRKWGTVVDGESLWWPGIARNKRSVAIDLRAEEGRALVRRMARSVDVVLENLRPGRLAEWGLSHDDLAKENPGLITVHISGFGQTGPRSSEAGFGSIAEAVGGIRHTTGSPDRPPARAGISLGDALASVFAVIGTTSALVERSRSGLGQEVDVAIYEAVLALMESTLADYEVAGVVRSRSGSTLPGVAPSNAYPTADGAEVLIAANADSVFRRLCAVMDRNDLAEDERFAEHIGRGVNMEVLDGIIGEWTATLTAQHLLERLAEAGVPAGRVYTAPDMLKDPHFVARDMIVRVLNAHGHEVPVNGIVPKFSRTPGVIARGGPVLGGDTAHVLRQLASVDDEELARLTAAGIVGTA
jgi:formyl-CoA transferase